MLPLSIETRRRPCILEVVAAWAVLEVEVVAVKVVDTKAEAWTAELKVVKVGLGVERAVLLVALAAEIVEVVNLSKEEEKKKEEVVMVTFGFGPFAGGNPLSKLIDSRP